VTQARPAVGLLWNPTASGIIAWVPELVEYLAVMPDRLWDDFGPQSGPARFHTIEPTIDDVRACADGRLVAGHGIGLSLPSAGPLDEALLERVADIAAGLGFAWFSEHLSINALPKGGLLDLQTGLGLPVACDEDSYIIVRDKLRLLKVALDCPLLLENPAIFTPIPEMEMSEPEFLNRLRAEEGTNVLLDFHNLFVTEKNGGVAARDYLDALDPRAVMEIHVAGGNELGGFYLDSHSGLTPPEVWEIAHAYAPHFPNLRAITLEYHESYFAQVGLRAFARELERMHVLAQSCARVSADAC
jgi:uncharacterized protein (UPF0276 family)